MSHTELPPEFARLRKDVGEWNAEITVTPQPGAAPQASTGRLSGRLICGGRWLVTEFKNQTTGFEGHGIYGYNAASSRYVGTWVDSMQNHLWKYEGTVDPTGKIRLSRKVLLQDEAAGQGAAPAAPAGKE